MNRINFLKSLSIACISPLFTLGTEKYDNKREAIYISGLFKRSILEHGRLVDERHNGERLLSARILISDSDRDRLVRFSKENNLLPELSVSPLESNYVATFQILPNGDGSILVCPYLVGL